MIKKTVTYTDFNGTERTEDVYFNLTEAEVAVLAMRDEDKGGIVDRLTTIVNSGDGAKIIETFEDIVRRSYGEKSEDGRRFVKSDEISSGFMASQAYSKIFMELISDPNAAAEFINGVMPENFASVSAQAAEAAEAVKAPTPTSTPTQPDPFHKVEEEPTPESQGFTDEQMKLYERMRQSMQSQGVPTKESAEGDSVRPPHESGPGFYAG